MAFRTSLSELECRRTVKEYLPNWWPSLSIECRISARWSLPLSAALAPVNQAVVQRWKNPTHTFPSRRRSIFLIQRHGARQLAANTSEVEVDWRAKWIRFACQRSW
jgi:hypothetical protein